jgi:hypothetical protein
MAKRTHVEFEWLPWTATHAAAHGNRLDAFRANAGWAHDGQPAVGFDHDAVFGEGRHVGQRRRALQWLRTE